jgi:Tol biopolymer transport system component
MATSGVLSVALVILAAIAVRGPAPPPEPPEIRFDLATPSSSGPLQVGASPDGQTVVFGVTTASGNSIWSRPIGSPEAGPISGTEGALNGAWSPDSRQIAFVVQGKLKRVPASGGTPETICDAAGTIRGASWNADNVIVFSRDGEIYRVPAIGGVPVKLPLEAPGSSRWEYPWFLPDGERFLLLARGGDANTRGVYVASLEAGTPVRLGAAETRVAFAQPDQLLFVRDDALYAQTLDTRKLQLVGEPVRIADDVGANLINGVAGFGVSQTGMLVHRGSATFGTRQLRWYTRDGTPRETIGDSANIWEFALAPDGRRVAFTSRVSIARTADVWTVDLASNITSRLTADSVGVRGVLWSRDSRSVTFGKDGSESPLHAKRVGDATDSIVYKPDGTTTLAEDYSPDSRTLLIRRPDTLLALPLSGDRKPVVLAVIRGVDEVRFSPDGRRVSYGTNVDDRQIYVADYPALDNRRQVSANGGRQARWRGDGKELYFLDPGGKVMVAAVRPGSATEFLAPTVLFQSPLANPSSVTDQFDVTRDGQRFLFAVSTDGSDATSASLSVLFNWQNALKK